MIKETQTQVNILLIDDDKEDIELFEDALKLYIPHNLFDWLHDGRKMHEYFTDAKGNVCNIIFLDINMPFMDGFTCLKAIRKMKALDDVPVIMFSTYKFENDIEKSFSCGANMYVQKPFDFKLYDVMLKKIFYPGWESRLLQTKKENFLLQLEESIFS